MKTGSIFEGINGSPQKVGAAEDRTTDVGHEISASSSLNELENHALLISS
jgi:hypothetical protein